MCTGYGCRKKERTFQFQSPQKHLADVGLLKESPLLSTEGEVS
jgi:hypothetical protein